MRLFNCLSQNSSVLVERESRAKKLKEKLNFRNKKRRASPYGGKPMTPKKSVRFDNKENQDPNVREICNERVHVTSTLTSVTSPDLETTAQLIQQRLLINASTPKSSKTSTWSSRRAAHNAYNNSPVKRTLARSAISNQTLGKPRGSSDPLPPLPKDQSPAPHSIYIKELDNTQDLNDDYLPLSQVFSPLREDEDDTTAATLNSSRPYMQLDSLLPCDTLRDSPSRRYDSTACDTASFCSGAYTRYDSSLDPGSIRLSPSSPQKSIVPYSVCSDSQMTEEEYDSQFDSQFDSQCDSQVTDYSQSQLAESQLTESQLQIAAESQLTAQTCSLISVGDYSFLNNIPVDTRLPAPKKQQVISSASLDSVITSSCDIPQPRVLPSSVIGDQHSAASLMDKAFVSSASSLPRSDSGVSSASSGISTTSCGTSTTEQHIYQNCTSSVTCEDRVADGATQLRSHFQELCAQHKNNDYVDIDATETTACSAFSPQPSPSYLVPYDNIPSSQQPLSPTDNRASEFLGCMSFGVQHLLNKDVDGWYYMLTEEVGRKKHLQAHPRPRPVLTSRSGSTGNVPATLSRRKDAVEGQERIVISVAKGKNGFGFSFTGELPPKVGRVDRASPAEQAGIKKGDLVIKVNGQNVSRSTCEGVASLVKKLSPQSLTLELQRDHVVTASVTRAMGTSTDHLYESISGCKENRPAELCDVTEAEEEEDVTQDMTHLNSQPKVTSTPFPARSNQTAPMTSARHYECLHRLMSLEFEYIDFMHYGTERFSRPLRHCILPSSQHQVIFQNVEKLVTISEYHVKQMQQNSGNTDTDDSQSSQEDGGVWGHNSLALIYQSKIHMLCQAYETYAKGLARSNSLLRELRSNKDFMNFIKSPQSDDGQSFQHMTLTSFIHRPLQHIQQVFSTLSEMLHSSPPNSPDLPSLQAIVVRLSHCVATISSLHRAHSMDSLSSGATGSIVSLASTASSTDTAPVLPVMSSVHPDVARVQDRLVFNPDVPTFQLCASGRELVHQGEIYRSVDGVWCKSQLLLFSDLLLCVDVEADGRYRVTHSPVYVHDIQGLEANRRYASEFILHLHGASCTDSLTLRAPSSNDKSAWCNVLQHRVTAMGGGRLQQYGSVRDIAHVKTSVIL